MLIDAHCHLADLRIGDELPRILAEALRCGIGCFVQGGVEPEDWKRQAGLKARFPGQIITAYGLHPWWVASHSRVELEKGLAELEKSLSEADSLGEAGLDFSPRFGQSTHELQALAFEKQLELRRRFPRPLVLHVVGAGRAHARAIEILKKAEGPAYQGLVHSFSASREVACRYLDLGFSLSVSGVITRKGYETLRRALRSIPGDRLVVETDSPDQAPAGWEKRLNEPSSLPGIAQAVGEIRGESAETVLERSAANLRLIFEEQR